MREILIFLGALIILGLIGFWYVDRFHPEETSSNSQTPGINVTPTAP